MFFCLRAFFPCSRHAAESELDDGAQFQRYVHEIPLIGSINDGDADHSLRLVDFELVMQVVLEGGKRGMG